MNASEVLDKTIHVGVRLVGRPKGCALKRQCTYVCAQPLLSCRRNGIVENLHIA